MTELVALLSSAISTSINKVAENFLSPEFNYIFQLDSFQNNRNIYDVIVGVR